jgi:Flp pilus assembly pilin Flp
MSEDRVWRDGFWRDRFWRDEGGQDLVEYSLLLAFVCLSGAAMFIGMGQNVNGIWSIVNSRLNSANQSS